MNSGTERMDVAVISGRDNKPVEGEKYSLVRFFLDESNYPSARWYQPIGEGLVASIDGRRLIEEKCLTWELFGEDVPSQVGETAEKYFKSPPNGTELMLFNWDGGYATRSGWESISMYFYGIRIS